MVRISVETVISKLRAEACNSLSLDEIQRCASGCVMPNAMMISAVQLINENKINKSDLGVLQK